MSKFKKLSAVAIATMTLTSGAMLAPAASAQAPMGSSSSDINNYINMFNGFVAGLNKAPVAQSQAPVQNSTSAQVSQIITQTNQQRAAYGKSQLRTDSGLSVSAKSWAQYLANTGQFNHDKNRSTGQFRGENLYGNSGGSTANAVNAWMKSDGHRANILWNDYTSVGVGIAYAPNGSVVVVQRFN